MKKYRFLFAALLISLLFCLPSCGKKEEQTQKAAPTEVQTEGSGIVEKADETNESVLFSEATDSIGVVSGYNSELQAIAFQKDSKAYIFVPGTPEKNEEYVYKCTKGEVKLTYYRAFSDFTVFTLSDSAQLLNILPYNSEANSSGIAYFYDGAVKKTEITLDGEKKSVSGELKHPAIILDEDSKTCCGIILSDKMLLENIDSALTSDSMSTPYKVNPPVENEQKKRLPLFSSTAAVILAALILCYIFLKKPSQTENKAIAAVSKEMSEPKTLTIGKLHNIGKRPSQQDCMGTTDFPGGMIAVVADGMGGLTNSDRVSREVVMTLLQNSASLNKSFPENPLFELTSLANKSVNRILGNDGQMKSGSTLVSVVINNGFFHWISVGDSRIYLFRNKSLMQLNREHNYESDLINAAINGEVPFSEIKTHPKRYALTSFIGMGRLEHIDGSRVPIRLTRGDAILLMSDGVYNTLDEEEIINILLASSHSEAAAKTMEQRITAAQKPKQDNFTAIIIGME